MRCVGNLDRGEERELLHGALICDSLSEIIDPLSCVSLFFTGNDLFLLRFSFQTSALDFF